MVDVIDHEVRFGLVGRVVGRLVLLHRHLVGLTRRRNGYIQRTAEAGRTSRLG